MTDINPESFREEMQTYYTANTASRDSWGRIKGESIVFDELSYFRDGKKEFIIGTCKEKEYVPERKWGTDFGDRWVSAHTETKSTIFCMPLEKGKLSGEPLHISASSCGEYQYLSSDYDGPYTSTQKAETSVEITVGSRLSPSFNYSKKCRGYRDVTDLAQISDAVVLGEREWGFDTWVKGDSQTAIKICDRFLGPRGEASRLVRAEQERLKRVKRFGELRAKVEKKREKLAEKKTKQEAKMRVEEAKRKQMMTDKFAR